MNKTELLQSQSPSTEGIVRIFCYLDIWHLGEWVSEQAIQRTQIIMVSKAHVLTSLERSSSYCQVKSSQAYLWENCLCSPLRKRGVGLLDLELDNNISFFINTLVVWDLDSVDMIWNNELNCLGKETLENLLGNFILVYRLTSFNNHLFKILKLNFSGGSDAS